MFIRSQDKTTVVNFSSGIVFVEGSYIEYAPEPDGDQVDLAEFGSDERAQAVFDIFSDSLSADFFDFSLYQSDPPSRADETIRPPGQTKRSALPGGSFAYLYLEAAACRIFCCFLRRRLRTMIARRMTRNINARSRRPMMESVTMRTTPKTPMPCF